MDSFETKQKGRQLLTMKKRYQGCLHSPFRWQKINNCCSCCNCNWRVSCSTTAIQGEDKKMPSISAVSRGVWWDVWDTENYWFNEDSMKDTSNKLLFLLLLRRGKLWSWKPHIQHWLCLMGLKVRLQKWFIHFWQLIILWLFKYHPTVRINFNC